MDATADFAVWATELVICNNGKANKSGARARLATNAAPGVVQWLPPSLKVALPRSSPDHASPSDTAANSLQEMQLLMMLVRLPCTSFASKVAGLACIFAS